MLLLHMAMAELLRPRSVLVGVQSDNVGRFRTGFIILSIKVKGIARSRRVAMSDIVAAFPGVFDTGWQAVYVSECVWRCKVQPTVTLENAGQPLIRFTLAEEPAGFEPERIREIVGEATAKSTETLKTSSPTSIIGRCFFCSLVHAPCSCSTCTNPIPRCLGPQSRTVGVKPSSLIRHILSIQFTRYPDGLEGISMFFLRSKVVRWSRYERYTMIGLTIVESLLPSVS